MNLSTSLYNDIMHEYQVTRFHNENTHEARVREVEQKISGFSALSDEIRDLALSSAKNFIAGDENALKDVSRKIEDLSAKKKALLKQNGFPEDYLSPIYNCPLCKDTGYIGNERCACLKKRIAHVKYDQSNITEILKDENFEKFNIDIYSPDVVPDMQKVYNGAAEYVKNFSEDSGSLLFLGPVGSGKTFMTNCIVKGLLDKGVNCLYFSSFNLFRLLSDATFGKTNAIDSAQLHEDLYTCDVLIIDDLGTELPNSLVRSQFFTILNERMIRKHPVIISSNLSLEKIKSSYSERSFSRLLSTSDLYMFKSADIRLRK
ncbi:MAG: ATP-binding protein [Lachnospiraceae bacterium]|nr:ATP-binding protein [Lachnospiraceae bacterium]